jgi:serine/threonine protein kinase
MELIEGRTLEHVLERRGKLPWNEVLSVGNQMCAGLSVAHARHIIHRDIKPANVFIATGGVVKIGDFGLARAVREMNISHTRVCGTPLYMSPEQIRGADVDFRSDLYAVGCTLFELLTGRPPFLDGEILYHHVHTPPPDPASLEPSVPPAVSQLVLACLAKNKSERVESALALRTLIRGAAKGG